MRLINTQLASELPAIGSLVDIPKEAQFARALFLSKVTPAKWLILGFDADINVVFCYADMTGEGFEFGSGLGFASIDDLEATRIFPTGEYDVIRDEDFVPMPLLECIDSRGRIIA